LIYLIIGIFAILAVFGSSSEKDSKGAIQVLLGQPFGKVIVWVLIVGLCGYVLWRLFQAIVDPDDHGHGPKAYAIRASLLVSAFTYGALCLYALSLLGVFSSGTGGSGGGGSSFAQTLNEIVGAGFVTFGLGVVFAGVAIAHFWKAFKQKYEKHLDASDDEMRLIHPIAMVGLVGRGAVFAVLAVLSFYRLFWLEAPQGDSPGLGEALQFLQAMPLGWALLAGLGVGLLAFSLYSFIEARWRRINLEAV
jgi:Domain of Unknown Function (DUF1206)